MAYTPTRDEVSLAAYQIIRDGRPDGLEADLRAQAKRFMERLGDGGAGLPRQRDEIRERYLSAFERDAERQQAESFRAELETIRAKYKPARNANDGSRETATDINPMVAESRAIAELAKARPDLVDRTPGRYRERAYAQLRAARPWLLLDLGDAAHGTAIGETGRTGERPRATSPRVAPRAAAPARPVPRHAVAADMAISIVRTTRAQDARPNDPEAITAIRGELERTFDAGGLRADAGAIARGVMACPPSIRAARLASELSRLLTSGR